MSRQLLALFILLFVQLSFAITLPNTLKQNELDDVTRLLGFNTSTKLVSQPYPLGGFEGLELAISQEFIDVSELGALGDLSSTDDSFSYNQISVGKGLYNDWDVYVHFVPFSKSNQISEYGGLIKWGAYEADYLPLSLAFLGHMNSINIEDDFINQSTGLDALLAITANSFSLYFGAGYINTRSVFKRAILDTSDPELNVDQYKKSFDSSHSFVGVNFDIDKAFVALQIDRYKDPVYSIKLGVRL